MRPVSRSAKHSSMYMQVISSNIIASISGSTLALGQAYQDAIIVLFNKNNLQPIGVCKPKQNGEYKFSGISGGVTTFVVAFDKKNNFNAVIQDNVVPK